MAANSKGKISDAVTVEVNGEQVDVKGPDPERLRSHRNELRRFKESPDSPKGPARDR